MTENSPKVSQARVDAVLPPDGRGPAPTGQEAHDAANVSRIIAHWMDEFFRIPGTNIRVGLDPLMGLIPFVGGLLSSGISLVIVAEAARLGLPRAVLARMGVNILFNEILESIPLAGDLMSVFFRSNTRNIALLDRWKAGEHAVLKRGSKFMMCGVVALLAVLLAGWFFLWITIFLWAWRQITG